MKRTGAPCASAAAASDIVVVVVGPERKRYTLHKRLLTYHSGYFRRVLKDGVNECNLHHLHRVYDKSFDILVDWMYEKALPSYTENESKARMLLAYMLAEDLSVGSLKRTLMDRIFHLLSGSYLNAVSVRAIFLGLPGNNPLLQLTVDTFCINNGVERMSVEMVAEINDLPKEFLARVLRKLHQLSELPEVDRVLTREDYIMVVCMPNNYVEEE